MSGHTPSSLNYFTVLQVKGPGRSSSFSCRAHRATLSAAGFPEGQPTSRPILTTGRSQSLSGGRPLLCRWLSARHSSEGCPAPPQPGAHSIKASDLPSVSHCVRGVMSMYRQWFCNSCILDLISLRFPASQRRALAAWQLLLSLDLPSW